MGEAVVIPIDGVMIKCDRRIWRSRSRSTCWSPIHRNARSRPANCPPVHGDDANALLLVTANGRTKNRELLCFLYPFVTCSFKTYYANSSFPLVHSSATLAWFSIFILSLRFLRRRDIASFNRWDIVLLR